LFVGGEKHPRRGAGWMAFEVSQNTHSVTIAHKPFYFRFVELLGDPPLIEQFPGTEPVHRFWSAMALRISRRLAPFLFLPAF
jgi:hypothetical protein